MKQNGSFKCPKRKKYILVFTTKREKGLAFCIRVSVSFRVGLFF